VSAPAGPDLLTWSSRVTFHPLSYQKDGDVYLVGRAESPTFIEIPEIGAQVMRLLMAGATLEEARDQLDYDGQPPDVLDFVETLVACGLVAEVDGRPLSDAPPPAAEPGRGLEVLRRLEQDHVRWLVSPPALVVHAAVLPSIAAILWLHPDAIPSRHDFFWIDWFSILVAGLVLTAWFFIFLHELGHVVAARAYGLRSRLSVGRRLYKAVAQTEIEGIWTLPRRSRIVVYLSGVTLNAWIFLVALCLVTFWAAEVPEPLRRWLRLVLVFEWQASAWQLMFYMKTDGYYLIADVTRERNLMEDAQAYLRGRLSSLAGRRRRPAATERPRRTVQVYAVFYVLGVAFAIIMLSVYVLPFMVESSYRAVQTLARGPSAGLARMADSVVILALFGFNVTVFLRVLLRERLRRRPRPVPATQT
jgi:putative peptide zinc metalloprotease protein